LFISYGVLVAKLTFEIESFEKEATFASELLKIRHFSHIKVVKNGYETILIMLILTKGRIIIFATTTGID
jgi:hypothetical protein